MNNHITKDFNKFIINPLKNHLSDEKYYDTNKSKVKIIKNNNNSIIWEININSKKKLTYTLHIAIFKRGNNYTLYLNNINNNGVTSFKNKLSINNYIIFYTFLKQFIPRFGKEQLLKLERLQKILKIKNK